jgi:lysophospholipase L1-like esterase
LLDNIKKNNMSCDDLGHPSEEGNQFIANEILKKLK